MVSGMEETFERLRKFINDEAAQIAQYPDPMRFLIANGSDTDRIPGGYGGFGASSTNPIPVNGPIGEVLYLSALRIGGQRLLFHRIKSVRNVDVFECVSIDGKHWDILYLDMYHPRKSKIAPVGYEILAENVLLSGVTAEVHDFPRSLYPQIVSYSERRFGMSIADPKVRIAVETVTFKKTENNNGKPKTTADAHAVQAEAAKSRLVQELVNEAGGSQIVLFEQLKKLTDFDETINQQQLVPELVYFVLALTTHALFVSDIPDDLAPLADQVSIQVLRLNLESDGIKLKLSDAVGEYRDRFFLYRDTMPLLTKDHFGFGLVVSEKIYGQESAVLGAVLSAAAVIIIDQLKHIIEEHRRK
jgi:hypothetical protein